MFQFNKIKLDKNSILIALAAVAVIVTLALFLNSNDFSANAVAKKSVDYLGDLLPGQTVTLLSVSGENGLVKMEIAVDSTTYTSYATRNGKLLFPQAFDLTSDSSSPDNQNGQQNQSSVDIASVKIEGEPFIGKDNAPVVMAEWFDYQCPFCQRVDQQVMPQLIKDYVDKGQLKIVFKDYQFLGDDSQTAGLIGRAVWELAPDKFYQWHKAMFEKQDDENGGWGSKEDILAMAKSLGINTSKIEQLLNSKGDLYQKALDDSLQEGRNFGINGTPSTIIGQQMINGAQPYATFKSAVDSVLGQ